MFATETSAAGVSRTTIDGQQLRYVYERVQRICRASRECNDAAHPTHEAEWNDKVHSPVLELALELKGELHSTHPIIYHNITSVRIDQRFRDKELFPGGDRVDYGIFLSPHSDSDLGQRIASHQYNQRNTGKSDPQLHALYAYEPDRPLVISIETKRKRGSDAQAPSQLANWARAHFRAVAEALGTSNDDDDREGMYDMVHPLIELDGTTWHIHFAVREGKHMAVYSSIRLGSTETLTDCYALLGSLEYLACWAKDVCWDWWLSRFIALDVHK